MDASVKTHQTSHWLLRPDNWWKAYLLGWFPIGLAYALILGLFVNIDGLTLITTWLANILVPVIMGIGVSWLILRIMHATNWKLQLALHTAGSIIFSTLWALGAFRLLQIFSGLLTGEWIAPNWPAPVIAWQLFQGVSIYFVICSGSYVYWTLKNFPWPGQEDEEFREERRRIFARKDDVILPIDIVDVTAIRAIDGATFIFQGSTQLESKANLSQLESELPERLFLRIHRSAIINSDHIQSIEPAGNGRMSVHMTNGETIVSSRAGTQILKSRLPLV